MLTYAKLCLVMVLEHALIRNQQLKKILKSVYLLNWQYKVFCYVWECHGSIYHRKKLTRCHGLQLNKINITIFLT